MDPQASIIIISDDDDNHSEDNIPEDDRREENNSGTRYNVNSVAPDNAAYIERPVIQVERLGLNHLLPEGWTTIKKHKSGMPVYYHRPTKTCTLSRPYFLGNACPKKHEIPLSAIPCLQYRRALKEKEKASKQSQDDSTSGKNGSCPFLKPLEIIEYCKNLFKFSIVKESRLKWEEKKVCTKSRRPETPKFTLDLTGPLSYFKMKYNDPLSKSGKAWNLDLTDRTCDIILDEYLETVWNVKSSYLYRNLAFPDSPYSATVTIGGVKYGFAKSSCQNQAKFAAARASLEILIPEIRSVMCRLSWVSDERKLSIFDDMKIEDPQVTEFCVKESQPPPYSLLLTCLRRNYEQFDMSMDSRIDFCVAGNVLVVSLGAHTVRVTCDSMTMGIQLASQQILQALHPCITSWGSLLRLYAGNNSIASLEEETLDEHDRLMLHYRSGPVSSKMLIMKKATTEMLVLRNDPRDMMIPAHDSGPSTSSKKLR